MKTSETITKIAPAFLKAQKNIQSVIKDSNNPFFKSKYADLTAVIEACKDHLNKEGISILQPIDGTFVETILIHESGEWFSSITPIVCKEENNPQALGSAITYAKRYGLQSMVLLPAEDDDGNAASEGEQKKKTTFNKPTVSQINFLYKLLDQKGKTEEALFKSLNIENLDDLSSIMASRAIEKLLKLPDKQKEDNT